jgi:hypothetical protein
VVRRESGSAGPVVRGLWLPVSAWLLATVVVGATAHSAGHSPFDPATWLHWDAFQYLDISRRGYELHRCVLSNGLEAWCGNSGWFPAYPWLIRGVASVGLDHGQVGQALAWAFGLATVMLIWAGFYPRVDLRAATVVLFAAFAPGLVYDYAVFPLSMLAFFTVLYLWLVKRRSWVFAGITGCVLVLVYPIGFAAPLAAAIALLVAYRRISLAERLRRIALASVLPAIALVVLPVDQRHETGHWNAYLLAQENFGHWLTDPFTRTIHAGRLLVHGKLFTLANSPYAQTLLVSVAILCVLVALVVGLVLRRTSLAGFQVVIVLWMLITWFVPQATTGTSQYRGEAALLPMAILIATLPRLLAAALIVAAVAVAIPMEVLFLRNVLI